MPEFSAELTFTQPIETVFAFHTRPKNLAMMIPGGSSVELAEAPELLVAGAEMEFKVSAMGFTQRLRMKVLEFAQPTIIIDEQIKGPFKSWRQTHRFETAKDGGTNLIYAVQFEPPGGMLGMLVTEKKILDGLKKAIPLRQYRTRELLDSENGH